MIRSGILLLCLTAVTGCRNAPPQSPPSPSGGEEPSFEVYLEGAELAKTPEGLLENLRGAVETADPNKFLQNFQLNDAVARQLIELADDYAPADEYIVDVIDGFERAPGCDGHNPEFVLRLAQGHLGDERLVRLMSKVDTWTGCTSEVPVAMIDLFLEPLLHNGGHETISAHATDIAATIESDQRTKKLADERTYRHALALFESLLVEGREDEAQSLGGQWLCMRVPKLDADALAAVYERLELTPKHPEMVCSQPAEAVPPMPSSAADEPKVETKPGEDGKTDGTEDK